MDVSMYLARFLGLYFLIVSILWVFRHAGMKEAAVAMTSNRAIVAYSGIVSLLIGSAIVVAHNVWSSDFRAVITLIGYFALLQGILRVAFTDSCMRTFAKLTEATGSYFLLALTFLIGLFLCYEGFVR